MPTRRRTQMEGGDRTVIDEQPTVIGELQGRLEQLETTAAEAQELRGRVEQLQAEAEDANNRYLRMAADFENFRRRARQEQLESIEYGSRELVTRLLPVVDDFERVLAHAPENVDPSWLKGLELAVNQLEDLLAQQGVTPIEAVGEAFDPAVHEAIGSEESSEHPEDTVVSELRRGYRLHDRVIRPALVRVARPPALPSA